ncbi:MAG: hypothetical protein LBU47_08100 [Christensenellaceae bacterium]|jgi:hypothetical protein|nr:hypothetical protein [Christensenellaceae bacterium]
MAAAGVSPRCSCFGSKRRGGIPSLPGARTRTICPACERAPAALREFYEKSCFILPPKLDELRFITRRSVPGLPCFMDNGFFRKDFNMVDFVPFGETHLDEFFERLGDCEHSEKIEGSTLIFWVVFLKERRKKGL